MSDKSALLKLHSSDQVAIARRDIKAGEVVTVDDEVVEIKEDISTGHKVAVADIAQGTNVIKFGASIGHAVVNIGRGTWVHSHNVKTNLAGKLEYDYQPQNVALSLPEQVNHLPKTFQGYVRENGDVGIRNEIWIINTVGCINKSAEKLAQIANTKFRDAGVDGVYHFAHPYGCSQLGDDLLYTQKLLAGLVRHPNAAGVLVMGLGCENNRIHEFMPFLGDYLADRVKFLNVQGVQDELEEGLDKISELVAYAQTFQRQAVPVSRLKVGLKCGGSDGFSGITANPLIGATSDLLVSNGATTFLTEVPEMFGAETILMNRANNATTYKKIVDLINDFKDYYTRHNQVIYENPSPGNKDGGITTLEEKSLGCTQKGGHSLVVDVLAYGDAATQSGLNLVQAPGNDMVSVTALIAAGAHIVLFSTGRGTPLGGAVPTIKVSTNSTLTEQKPHWIDIDAGRLLSGVSMEELSTELYKLIVDVASGIYYTKNERHDYREIAIFKDGVTL